jgi:Flp pilus assembly protein TadG
MLTSLAAGLRRSLLGRFARGERGSVMAWAAFMMVPLLGFGGLALDTARGYMVKARLQQAMDAAALAGGKYAQNDTAMRDAAVQMFNANFPPGYLGATVSGPNVAYNNESVTISASATLDTAFMHLVGLDNITVSGQTEVTRKTVYMDVVISVDVSGSMNSYVNGGKKIDAARNAALTLTDILFGPSATKDLLKMGVVQWDSNVNVTNVGSTFTGSTQTTVPSFINPYTGASQNRVWYANNSSVPLLEQPPAGWRGCVLARYIDDGQTNDADIHSGLLTVGNKAWMGFRVAQDYTYNCGTSKKPKTCTASYQCPRDGIQRLTNTKATVVSAINRINYPQQNTSLVMGLFWAWQVLDATAPFTEATVLPPGSEGSVVRAIVLMTDGANTQADGDAYGGDLTASGLNTRTQTIATNIKNSGVLIYAIQFDYLNSSQEALMKSIASGPTSPYYQYAPDSAALNNAFKEIGNHLSKLRIAR